MVYSKISSIIISLSFFVFVQGQQYIPEQSTINVRAVVSRLNDVFGLKMNMSKFDNPGPNKELFGEFDPTMLQRMVAKNSQNVNPSGCGPIHENNGRQFSQNLNPAGQNNFQMPNGFDQMSQNLNPSGQNNFQMRNGFDQISQNLNPVGQTNFQMPNGLNQISQNLNPSGQNNFQMPNGFDKISQNLNPAGQTNFQMPNGLNQISQNLNPSGQNNFQMRNGFDQISQNLNPAGQNNFQMPNGLNQISQNLNPAGQNNFQMPNGFDQISQHLNPTGQNNFQMPNGLNQISQNLNPAGQNNFQMPNGLDQILQKRNTNSDFGPAYQNQLVNNPQKSNVQNAMPNIFGPPSQNGMFNGMGNLIENVIQNGPQKHIMGLNQGANQPNLYDIFQKSQSQSDVNNIGGYNKASATGEQGVFQKTQGGIYNGMSNFDDILKPNLTGCQSDKNILGSNWQSNYKGNIQTDIEKQLLQQKPLVGNEHKQNANDNMQQNYHNPDVDNFIKRHFGQDIFDYDQKGLKFDNSPLKENQYPATEESLLRKRVNDDKYDGITRFRTFDLSTENIKQFDIQKEHKDEPMESVKNKVYLQNEYVKADQEKLEEYFKYAKDKIAERERDEMYGRVKRGVIIDEIYNKNDSSTKRTHIYEDIDMGIRKWAEMGEVGKKSDEWMDASMEAKMYNKTRPKRWAKQSNILKDMKQNQIKQQLKHDDMNAEDQYEDIGRDYRDQQENPPCTRNFESFEKRLVEDEDDSEATHVENKIDDFANSTRDERSHLGKLFFAYFEAAFNPDTRKRKRQKRAISVVRESNGEKLSLSSQFGQGNQNELLKDLLDILKVPKKDNLGPQNKNKETNSLINNFLRNFNQNQDIKGPPLEIRQKRNIPDEYKVIKKNENNDVENRIVHFAQSQNKERNELIDNFIDYFERQNEDNESPRRGIRKKRNIPKENNVIEENKNNDVENRIVHFAQSQNKEKNELIDNFIDYFEQHNRDSKGLGRGIRQKRNIPRENTVIELNENDIENRLADFTQSQQKDKNKLIENFIDFFDHENQDEEVLQRRIREKRNIPANNRKVEPEDNILKILGGKKQENQQNMNQFIDLNEQSNKVKLSRQKRQSKDNNNIEDIRQDLAKRADRYSRMPYAEIFPAVLKDFEEFRERTYGTSFRKAYRANGWSAKEFIVPETPKEKYPQVFRHFKYVSKTSLEEFYFIMTLRLPKLIKLFQRTMNIINRGFTDPNMGQLQGYMNREYEIERDFSEFSKILRRKIFNAYLDYEDRYNEESPKFYGYETMPPFNKDPTAEPEMEKFKEAAAV